MTSTDERAAMRAFLQRCEVRLSTMHRVATALLSGAGILVLLPAVERDAVLQVLRSLLAGPVSWSRGILALAVALSIMLAITVLWFLIIELTRFYFHGNHVVRPDGEVFTPRFTLTGVRISDDEFDSQTGADYAALHSSSAAVRLLVPGNARARARIDRQLGAYPGLVDPATAADPDEARARALFELAAARQRPLVEEVVKIEYGIVRHMLRLQVIVLRYVKALLVIVVTSLAAFAAAAAVNGQQTISAADERWIAGAMMLWSPVVMIVVSSPVRWIESLLRSEGATHAGVGRDPELTRLEDVTSRFAVATWLLAAGAMVLLLVHHTVSEQGRVAVAVAVAVSLVLVVTAVRQRMQAHRGES
jgi:hypothetical protein